MWGCIFQIFEVLLCQIFSTSDAGTGRVGGLLAVEMLRIEFGDLFGWKVFGFGIFWIIFTVI